MKALLDMIGLLDAKSMFIPMSSSKLLSKVDGHVLADPLNYRRLVASFQYLTLMRFDIAFGVNKLYQFMEYPTDIHMIAAKRML